VLVSRATLADLDQLSALFDGYRQFYQQPSNVPGAQAFLEARIKNQESVIFVATINPGKLAGFVQLYPSFTSVGMTSTWILNDLFVAPEFRQQKIGEGLLAEAVRFSKASGARNLSLQTAITNASAQRLYEKMGWHRDEKYYTYYFHHPEFVS
jgi:ribosomal protein S18 acetylase RimI-like enzyme